MKFFLPMTPPKTTAQAQRKATTIQGRARIYTTAEGKAIEHAFEALLVAHRPVRPLQGPLRCHIVAVWPWRKNATKRDRAKGRIWKDTKPDSGNFAKMLEDAMERMGFFTNDAQLCDCSTQKFWGDEPGIWIELEELEV